MHLEFDPPKEMWHLLFPLRHDAELFAMSFPHPVNALRPGKTQFKNSKAFLANFPILLATLFQSIEQKIRYLISSMVFIDRRKYFRK